MTKQLYPFLLKKTTSIEDAKTVLEMSYSILEQVFQQRVMQFQKELSDKPLSELEILAVLDKQPQTERERELIEMFANEKVAIADALLQGMKKDIEGRIREEGTKRHLDTVKSEFNDAQKTDF